MFKYAVPDCQGDSPLHGLPAFSCSFRKPLSAGHFFVALRPVAALIFLLWAALPPAPAQPARMKWFPVVKTAKDQRTLSLLTAGPEGFHLLRWQDRRSDGAGQLTPAMPLLTVLAASGERLYDEPLPGFADGDALFRFAFAADSVLLVFYEAPDPVGGQGLFYRRFNLNKRRWSAAPELVFSEPVSRAPAFAAAWYSRSANGQHWCVYRPSRVARAPLSVAVFDRTFQLRWRRSAALPGQAGPLAVQQVLCTNSGAVAVQARIFDASLPAPRQGFEEPPAAYRPDGRPLYRPFEQTAELPPHANALFVLAPDKEEPVAFYPNVGKKFTPSFELTEGPDGRIYAAGLSADNSNAQVSGYFVYAIDPGTGKGDFLQNTGLPASLRKAVQGEKAAAKKEPVEGLALRWLDWADGGKPWMFVESENFESTPGRLETAALLRLDSTFRVTAARKIEKFQQVAFGEAQNFASAAACPAAKGAWWVLWNEGRWPETKFMLTDCRPNGEPAGYMLDAASRSNVTFLPHTLLKQDGRWYFVGESEYHERIRVGVLEHALDVGQ